MLGPPIEEIVRAGLAFNPRLPMGVDDIRSSVVILFDDLERLGVDYVLVGGVALLSYVEGRNTQDVDLIVDASDLARMSWTIEARDENFARADLRGLRVDLLLADNLLFSKVRRLYTTTGSFGGREVRTATREGLLLLKMYALPSLYRQGQWARAALYETDILMLHQGASVDDEKLLGELAPHVEAADLSEIRRILEEQRGRRRFGA
jgi:hypothetical protein